MFARDHNIVQRLKQRQYHYNNKFNYPFKKTLTQALSYTLKLVFMQLYN